MVPGAWFDGCSQLLTTVQEDLVSPLNSSLIHKVCAWLGLPGCNKDHVEKCALLLPACGSWQEQQYSHKYHMSLSMGQLQANYPSFTDDHYRIKE